MPKQPRNDRLEGTQSGGRSAKSRFQKHSLRLPLQQLEQSTREVHVVAKSSRPASARHPRKNTNPEWQQQPSTAPFHRAHGLLQKSISKNFLALTKNASANSAETAPTVHYMTFLREKHSLSGEYTATSTTAGAGLRREDPLVYRLAESSRPASGMPASRPGLTFSPRSNYVDRVNSRM